MVIKYHVECGKKMSLSSNTMMMMMMIISNQDERIKIIESMRKYESDINAFRWHMFCDNYHYNEWQTNTIPEILGRYGITIAMVANDGDPKQNINQQLNNKQQQLKQRFDQHRSQFEQLRHPRLRILFQLINNRK